MQRVIFMGRACRGKTSAIRRTTRLSRSVVVASVALFSVLGSTGCDSIDPSLATAAALEAVQAATLTDDEIRRLSAQAATVQDEKHQVAPPNSPYVKRLEQLFGRHATEQGIALNYKVYMDGKNVPQPTRPALFPQSGRDT